ncbi:MAG: hypothetical protein NTU53_13270 [Planctomycetota bacterium]|nr:hypothetical protein [Planctomycetota bacterium]
MRWITILMLLGAATAGCRNTASEPPRGSTPSAVGQADVPVAAVWLYPSGVAYVEHRGLANPGSAFELRLKSSQLDSAMKRITVQVGEDQQPAAIIQPLDKASSQTTQTRRIELSNNTAFPALLEQLRGGSVRLICARETIDATIISLEKKEQTTGDKRVEAHFLNILAAGSIRAVPLDTVQRVELIDPRLRQELTRALETPWQATDDDRKTITIPLQTKLNQPVRIAYTIDSTAWKPSYRLVLSQAPRLQLWATITNDTDYDWTRVQLNLMCGRPMVGDSDSLSDSASADRVARGPGVTLAEPLQWPKTIPSRQALDSESSNATKPDAAPPAPPPSRNPEPLATIDSSRAFCYAAQSVSIPRHSTATLLIAEDPASLEPVTVYNEKKFRANPLLGARLRNSTARYLLQGFLAVLDNVHFAGDATLENLPPGRSAVITWSIDLPVLIDSTHLTHTTDLVAGRIQDATLSLTRRHLYTRYYVADNQDRTDRKLMVEHPIRRGYVLLEPSGPSETTESLYRFETTAPAGKRTILTVVEQASEIEPVDLRTADPELLLSYSQNRSLSQPVRDALAKAATLKRRADEAPRNLQQSGTDPATQPSTPRQASQASKDLDDYLRDLKVE